MRALGWRICTVFSAICVVAAIGAIVGKEWPLLAGFALTGLYLAVLAERLEQREFARAQTEKVAAASSSDFARLARAVEILNETVGVQQQRFDVFTTNFTAAQALRPQPTRGADGHFTSPIRRG